MAYRYFAALLFVTLLLLAAPAFTQTDNPGPVVAWSIPPSILKKASAEYHCKVGSDYEGVMFPGGDPSGVLDADCLNAEGARGWVKIVIVIQKDGTPSNIYAQKHGPVYDCLVPKFAAAQFTPSPHAPFYEYFQLLIKK